MLHHPCCVVLQIFDYPTISDIATFLKESQLLPPALLAAATPSPPATTLVKTPGLAMPLCPAPIEPTTMTILIAASSTRAPGSTAPEFIQGYSPESACSADASTVVPLSRWDADLTLPAHLPGELQSRFGCFLPDVELFDPSAVGLTAAEALLVDPQQRLMLEVYADVHGATAAAGLASRYGGRYRDYLHTL